MPIHYQYMTEPRQTPVNNPGWTQRHMRRHSFVIYAMFSLRKAMKADTEIGHAAGHERTAERSPQIPSRHGWYYFGIMTFKKILGRAECRVGRLNR
jgi:hypothetical protein